MYKRIAFLTFLIFSILILMGSVCGSELSEVNKLSHYKTSDSKALSLANNNNNNNNNIDINKIRKIYTSKSAFKSGTNVKIKISTDKSVKYVLGSISSKNSFKFFKSKNGHWYYNLKTKGFKSGTYKTNIKAVDSKNRVYRKSVLLNVDNIAPKISYANINVKNITAGNPFLVEILADNTTKKVSAKIRGKTFYFNLDNSINNINDNLDGSGSSNTNTNLLKWTLNTKLSYKEIGTLTIGINVYDSVGNIAKKTLYLKSNPKYVYWDGSLLGTDPLRVNYINPINKYQKSIKELSKYSPVYEGFAGNGYTLGISHKEPYSKFVIIAYKDPFVVYHEMAHILHWGWSEYKCDWFAYNKTGHWIK